nr:glycoside hydrolase family 1 protein [Ardenticatena sp.]
MATTFPEGFLWGSATASHQVEGNNHNNDWWQWETAHPEMIDDASRSGAACAWWTGRAEEDLAQAAALGQNAHRLSLEWSRLEPEPGRFDDAAFARYREILTHMHALGLMPFVTLYHFTLPQWAAAMGGWTNPTLITHLARFAKVCATRLGDLVRFWITINEPMVLAFQAYAGRRWPPGIGRFDAGVQALRHLLRAHAAAYHAVKQAQPAAQVGIALNVPYFAPARASHPLDRLVARAQDWLFNGMKLRALGQGAFVPPLGWPVEQVPDIAQTFDFLGLNFYGRYDVRFDWRMPGMLFGRHVQQPTVRLEHNDWGQPDPTAFAASLRRLAKHGKPVYVTENGVLDNADDDQLRQRVLLQMVGALKRLLHEGIDVRGYFFWSLVDNYEWAEGWRARFGLIGVNPYTQARFLKPSAHLYAAICRGEIDVEEVG